jgi:anti-anti-sigma factor
MNEAYQGRPTPTTTDRVPGRAPEAGNHERRFWVVGDLGGHEARLLRHRVLDDLDNGERTFVVDLTQAQTFDAKALGILVSITRRVQEAHGVIEFDNVPEHVRLLFELMRLDRVFTIRDPRSY